MMSIVGPDDQMADAVGPDVGPGCEEPTECPACRGSRVSNFAAWSNAESFALVANAIPCRPCAATGLVSAQRSAEINETLAMFQAVADVAVEVDREATTEEFPAVKAEAGAEPSETASVRSYGRCSGFV